MPVQIHVNRHLVAKNRKTGSRHPVYAIRQGRLVRYAHGVTVRGQATLVDPRSAPPLPCGATIYIVVHEGSEIELVEPTSFQEIEKSS